MFVYSVTSENSFNALNKIRMDVTRIKENLKLPMVLVGNKSDLIEERSIKYETGVARAEEYGGVPFFETSAKDNKSISDGKIKQNIFR